MSQEQEKEPLVTADSDADKVFDRLKQIPKEERKGDLQQLLTTLSQHLGIPLQSLKTGCQAIQRGRVQKVNIKGETWTIHGVATGKQSEPVIAIKREGKKPYYYINVSTVKFGQFDKEVGAMVQKTRTRVSGISEGMVDNLPDDLPQFKILRTLD